MVGIGFEDTGVEAFVEGKFFNGELYIDAKKVCHQELGYKRVGFFNAVGSIFGKKGREGMKKSKEEKISGDLRGDGFQNGGTLIVSAGGKEVLLNYIQQSPPDHVPLEDILKALGLETPGGTATDKSAAEGATAVQN